MCIDILHCLLFLHIWCNKCQPFFNVPVCLSLHAVTAVWLILTIITIHMMIREKPDYYSNIQSVYNLVQFNGVCASRVCE